jgi:hypothetical protein
MIGSAVRAIVGSSRSSRVALVLHSFEPPAMLLAAEASGSSTSIASSHQRLRRRGAAPAHQRVGIFASGIVATRTARPWRSSSSPPRKVARSPPDRCRRAARRRANRRSSAPGPGERRAQRRHDVLDTAPAQAKHVEVSLDRMTDSPFGSRLGLVQVVELLPLVEDRRLRRVQVLGLAGPSSRPPNPARPRRS